MFMFSQFYLFYYFLIFSAASWFSLIVSWKINLDVFCFMLATHEKKKEFLTVIHSIQGVEVNSHYKA